jgi:hypothetical protein
MILLLYEHFICPLDHPMLMNALYMWCHLHHQSTHCHEHCPKLDRFILEQNQQRAQVCHLCHIIALAESGKSRLNLRFHCKTGTLLCLLNAFAASALMITLSTLLVTMHVDFDIQLGSCSIS